MQTKNTTIILKTTILFLIIAVSTFLAFSLNPIAKKINTASVAGESTIVLNNNLIFSPKYNTYRHEVNSNLEADKYLIQITPKTIQKGSYTTLMLNIFNDSNEKQQLLINQNIIGYVQDLVNINTVTKSGDQLEKITINPQGSFDVYVKLDIEENINFPFTIQFYFSLT